MEETLSLDTHHPAWGAPSRPRAWFPNPGLGQDKTFSDLASHGIIWSPPESKWLYFPILKLRLVGVTSWFTKEVGTTYTQVHVCICVRERWRREGERPWLDSRFLLCFLSMGIILCSCLPGRRCSLQRQDLGWTDHFPWKETTRKEAWAHFKWWPSGCWGKC